MNMIRINLLPIRGVKKREVGRQVVVLGVAVAVAAVALNLVWYTSRSAVAEKNQERIVATERQIKELEKVIGEVNNINKRKKEVEDKLKVLAELRKGRSGPVRMLDALALAVPKKVWILKFKEDANRVTITGTGMSHDDVAEFMRGLATVVWTPRGMGRLVEKRNEAKTARVELIQSAGEIQDFPTADVASFFKGIDLKKATQKEVAGSRKELTVKTVDFEINLSASYSI